MLTSLDNAVAIAFFRCIEAPFSEILILILYVNTNLRVGSIPSLIILNQFFLSHHHWPQKKQTKKKTKQKTTQKSHQQINAKKEETMLHKVLRNIYTIRKYCKTCVNKTNSESII